MRAYYGWQECSYHAGGAASMPASKDAGINGLREPRDDLCTTLARLALRLP